MSVSRETDGFSYAPVTARDWGIAESIRVDLEVVGGGPVEFFTFNLSHQNILFQKRREKCIVYTVASNTYRSYPRSVLPKLPITYTVSVSVLQQQIIEYNADKFHLNVNCCYKCVHTNVPKTFTEGYQTFGLSKKKIIKETKTSQSSLYHTVLIKLTKGWRYL